MNHIICY